MTLDGFLYVVFSLMGITIGLIMAIGLTIGLFTGGEGIIR